ncbi:MAG: LPS-assembly protein LptD [Burkholderiaceae bacterium]|nr:LPS-assembly protein LptD [Burkholderiaceae bacterium]
MLRILASSSSILLLRAAALLVVSLSLPALAQTQTAKVRRDKAADKLEPTTIQAEQITGRPDREVLLERDAEVVRGQCQLNSDKAIFYQEENEAEAEGNVRLLYYGDRYAGDKARLNLDTGVGWMTHPVYKLLKNNAQGKGERVDFESRDKATLTNGTYSTCEGARPDWYMRAGTLKIDKAQDTGRASNSVVYFKDVPIFAAPELSFPLTAGRKSGFLPPTMGTTTRGGLELSLPYYFNIAPNRDFTLTPKWITRRGMQLGGDVRYLEENYAGETKVEYLMNDREAGRDRYSIASTHTQRLSPNLVFSWNYNKVSDDNYFTDFSQNIGSVTNNQVPSAQRLLAREAGLNYSAADWSAMARVTNYQLLQDPASPITRPYERLPQLAYRTWRQDANGFDWSVDTELTRFWLPAFDLAGRPNGDRLVIKPQVSYPIIGAGYFIKPKLSIHASRYQLDSTTTSGSDSMSRTLPTFSLDSGLIFERDTKLFGNAVTQTLEPRLFYVYTPYRDQSKFPLFDTAEASFGFAQIFSENRFIGSDRIADANQLTAALVSRFLDPTTGWERLRLAIGQRFYFKDQRVLLDAATSTPNESRSDLLLAASGRLSKTVSFDTALQYSETTRRLYNANFSVQWQPAPKHVLNAEYRYLRENQLDQINLSGQWPLADRWFGVGRVSYSLPERRLVEGMAGVEYNADCWILRLVARRLATSAQDENTAFFIQLQLNGLSQIGSSPLNLLRDSIPGYQPVRPSSAAAN